MELKAIAKEGDRLLPDGAVLDHQTSTLADFLAVLRRRAGIVIAAIVLVPLSTVLIASQQTKIFEARSDVLLKRDNLANQLTNISSDQPSGQDSARVTQTQASIAGSAEVAARVVRTAGLDETPEQFLDRSSVTTEANTDLLEFAVRDERKSQAMRLAGVYADTYSAYRRELDTASLSRARDEVEKRIRALRTGERDAERRALLSNLIDKDEQLRTLEVLQTSNATVVQKPTSASQVQPRITRMAVLGVIVGIILAIGLALLIEALDTRIRTADEIERILHIPLLARLPHPPKARRGDDQLIALHQPRSPHVEPLRFLRANLDFASALDPVRSMVITSSVNAEGKSTTISNLAVMMARAGKDVVLIDLDLRSPSLSRIFDIGGSRGVAQILTREVALDEALCPIDVTRGDAEMPSLPGSAPGSLHVLPAGGVPPFVGEAMNSPIIGEIIRDAQATGATVLIDSPPLLSVGDALVIATKVDAVVMVTRLGVVRRTLLKESARLLNSTGARLLGYVVTGAELEGGFRDSYGYGYGYGYDSEDIAPPRAEVTPRT